MSSQMTCYRTCLARKSDGLDSQRVIASACDHSFSEVLVRLLHTAIKSKPRVSLQPFVCPPHGNMPSGTLHFRLQGLLRLSACGRLGRRKGLDVLAIFFVVRWAGRAWLTFRHRLRTKPKLNRLAISTVSSLDHSTVCSTISGWKSNHR